MSKNKVSISDIWNRSSHKLFVYLIEASGLKGHDKDGTSDPMAKVSIGKAVQKSKTIKKSVDPTFGDLFFFTDPESPTVTIELSCTKKSKFLGQAELANLDALAVEKINDVWVELQPKPGKKKKEDVQGKVHVRLVYSKVLETRMHGEVTNYRALYEPHASNFKTGDLIAYSGVGLLPELTKAMTGCPYTHLGLIVEMPNKWTKVKELYVVELYRNPDGFLDVTTDKPRIDISKFRLFERFYQFFGTQIWYSPLKTPVSADGATKMIEFIQGCYSDPREISKTTTQFDPSLQTWIQTTFGAKHFTDADFVDFSSASFVTECLRIGGVVPDGTAKAASPLSVVNYPCFNEPIVIRPFEKIELEKLQRDASNEFVPPPNSASSSGSTHCDTTHRPAPGPPGRSESQVASTPKADKRTPVVVVVDFEGFPDLKRTRFDISPGTTAGEFKAALVKSRGIDQNTTKIIERMNDSETEMNDSDPLTLMIDKNKGRDYMIKVSNSSVATFMKIAGPSGHDFDALGTPHTFKAGSTDTTIVGGRKMIIPEFQGSKIVKYEKLGSGAFGSVWRVGFEGFTCAMKTLTITDKTDAYDIESLKMETEILEKANHKNIVRYLGHEFREKEMRVFLEFVPFSLRGYLEEMKPRSVTPAIAKNIIINVARGLNYMHNLQPPIIHRDIKSANILCVRSADGGVDVAKLCDFGVSKLVEDDAQAQTYVGTLAFMAPEIRLGKGKKIYTTAVDIYSLGIVMWEILTLQRPNKITKRPDWSGPEFNPLYDLQAQCCRPNPQQRPTAKMIVDVLSLMYNQE